MQSIDQLQLLKLSIDQLRKDIQEDNQEALSAYSGDHANVLNSWIEEYNRIYTYLKETRDD